MESNGKLLEQQARQRLGMPESWQVFNWESVLDDERRIVAYQLAGAVIPIAAKGPRLGCRDYARKDQSTLRTVDRGRRPRGMGRSLGGPDGALPDLPRVGTGYGAGLPRDARRVPPLPRYGRRDEGGRLTWKTSSTPTCS